MSDKGNGLPPKTNGHRFTKIGPRFGREKPAIPGPGRPRLTDEERDARAILKDASPLAAQKLQQILSSHDEKNATRAAEIILSHVVPKLEEVTTHDDRPLRDFTDEQLAAKLREIEAGGTSHSNGNGASAR